MDVALAFAWDSPPLSIIADAKIVDVSLTIDPSLASGSVPTAHAVPWFFVSECNPLQVASMMNIAFFFGIFIMNEHYLCCQFAVL
jgi:hypothetical protein